jgi:hypothetical protein
MEVENALAYYHMTTITATISFVVQDPGPVFTTLFFRNLRMGPRS